MTFVAATSEIVHWVDDDGIVRHSWYGFQYPEGGWYLSKSCVLLDFLLQ